MNTKSWGPPAWKFLFSCIVGRYPDVLDESDEEHTRIKNHFIQLFSSLEIIMPCIYCRQSFEEFYKELDINEYLSSKRDLVFWLYLIKDKVNNKLMIQEKIEYASDKLTLVNLYKNNQITLDEYNERLKMSEKQIKCTIESPPFEQILNEYMGYMSQCSTKAKRCL